MPTNTISVIFETRLSPFFLVLLLPCIVNTNWKKGTWLPIHSIDVSSPTVSLGLASFQDHLGMRLARGNPLSAVACHIPVPQCVFSL